MTYKDKMTNMKDILDEIVRKEINITGAVVMPLDTLNIMDNYTSIDLYGGVLEYIKDKDKFGKPVVFYAWPHRINEAIFLIANNTNEYQLQAKFLNYLNGLHPLDTNKFLAKLDSGNELNAIEWGDKVINKEEVKSMVIEYLLGPALMHDLGRLERANNADDSKEIINSIVKEIEIYSHILFVGNDADNARFNELKNKDNISITEITDFINSLRENRG